MSRWRKTSLLEMGQYISQLGLTACHVCGGDNLMIHRQPLMQYIGSVDPKSDPEGNVLFLVGVECSTCGHLLLFNSERFHDGDQKTLIQGMTDEEEELLEQGD